MRQAPSVTAVLQELKRVTPRDRERRFREFCEKAEVDYRDINWMANRLLLANGDVEWRGQRGELLTFDSDGNIWAGLKSYGIKLV